MMSMEVSECRRRSTQRLIPVSILSRCFCSSVLFDAVLVGRRLTSEGNASQRPSWSLHVQVKWTEALQKPDILNLAI